MSNSHDLNKKIEQSEYRRKIVEAELNAVVQSKAYKIAKTASIIKNNVTSDPKGFTKKVARLVVKNPGKLLHAVRTGKRISFAAQSSIEQTNKYQEWILLNEPDEAELEEQRIKSEAFAYKPLISIITPVFNPPVDVLEELIESVLEQTYPNFELCLGNFGDDASVKSLIERYSKSDHRVKNMAFTENKGIAFNSNKILEKAKGEYVALLDHDDTLSLDALFENVKLLNEKDYDFIYSDKDKIDVDNNRFDPLFKPDLSPEMMLNINYLTHFNVMKTSVVKQIGGWDSSTDGAQDWDLFLRIMNVTDKIGHISKVLYHWRVIASSTALSIETKPYALAGQRKAVDNYLKAQNILAHSYHEKTELFLRWDEAALDKSPFVFIHFSNKTNTLRLMRHISNVTVKPRFIVLVDEKIADKDVLGASSATILRYGSKTYGKTIETYLNTLKLGGKSEKTTLFINDNIRLPRKSDWYENITGWLNIHEVAITSGRLVDRHDLIVDGGGLIKPDGTYFSLFYKYPRFYQSYLGNAEWVRDLSVASSNFIATKLSLLKQYKFSAQATKQLAFDNYCIWLTDTKKQRIVMTPHATASIYEEVSGVDESSRIVKNVKNSFSDPYSNVNMNSDDLLRLFPDEVLDGTSHNSPAALDAYQHDSIILANTFDISEKQINANLALLSDTKGQKAPESVAWVLPSFDAVYAGLMNIFSFANYLSETKGLETTVYILKNSSNTSHEKTQVIRAFPKLKKAHFIGISPEDAHAIKAHDIGIATQWATAYPLAKAMNVKRKWYFIQDNETNFYPKGSISSLVELSYRFGFKAVANTGGLLDMYEKQYGGSGVVVKSRVDLSSYYPRENVFYTPKRPYKVFFYARPNMPRNAFELGIAGLKALKTELGKDIEIITAGAAWDATAYGVEGMFTNLGKIDYEAVPKLYRSVDAGLMFMFSGHPGVTASELMASGCPVVVNEYNDITWHELYKNEKTCLTTKATASEVARNLKRLLEDQPLRKKLITGGLAVTKDFYSGYEKSCDDAYDQLLNN